MLLVDGYHLLCQSDNLNSIHDFGNLQTRLQAQGVQVAFFGTCTVAGKPPIEDLGNALGVAIRNLNAPQVDVVTHSMGGLILRSYLSGKQTASGVFTPPVDTKIRKWVSIATPNFGALIPNPLGAFLPDIETRQLLPGSQFLFDLATWNQNHDDLRGVDTVGIVGNAGGFGPLEGGSDGTVAVTSASMSFALPDERTRIVPYCHGGGIVTSLLGLGCEAPPIAKLQSDNLLSWQIIDSFLNDTDAWRSVGHSPRQDKYLARYGGLITQPRNNMDQVNGSIQDQNFVTDAPLPGGYTAVVDKAGPQVLLVAPSAARLSTLNLAPRMLISIYGNSLDGSAVTLNGQPLTVSYNSDHQLNTLLPTGISGLAKLGVSNSRGRAAVNVFVDRAAPALFSMNGSGTGVAAAIRNGNYVSLYLTGLGAGETPVAVTVNGNWVPVTYAGIAPGFPGGDQINIQIPAGTPGAVVVYAGKNASNTVQLP